MPGFEFTSKELKVLADALIGVPIGTILPYVGPLTSVLPASWVLCDGRVINDPASPFNNKRIPDLTDNRFLMGVNAAQAVPQPGGSNSWESAGQHTHSGSTGDANIGGYTPANSFETRGDDCHNHGHNVSIPSSGGHDHGEKRPAFMAVFFIIRIK